MKQKIKAVIFDVAGVLMGGTAESKQRKKRGGGFHDAIADKLEILHDTWFDAIDSVYGKSMEGSLDGKTVIRTISRNLGIPVSRIEKPAVQLYKKLLKKNKELFDIAHELKKKGYIVGVLSDQWYLSKKSLVKPRDFKMFDVIILSCDVGFRKPDIRIYKLLMKKLRAKDKGMKYSEVLFIDNRDYNLKPAEKLGMKTILFKGNEQCLEEVRRVGVEV